MNVFYKVMELFFALIGGTIAILLKGISNIEGYFHNKIEFKKYSKWIEEDKKYLKEVANGITKVNS